MFIALIKDSRLFAKTIDIPTGINSGEVASLVENEVEASPLWSGDKSVCSYIQFASTALVYEGSVDTVFADIEKNQLLEAKLVIPTSALLTAFDFQGVCVFEFDESISVANFEDGKITSFASCDILFDKSTAISDALSLAGISGENANYYKLSNFTCIRKQVKIDFQQLNENGEVLQTLSAKQKISALATAELRNVAELKKSKKSRTQKYVKKFSIFAVLAFVIFLCFWQISNILKESEIKSMQQHFDSISPTAAKIEAKSLEVARLAELTNKKMRPIEIMASINAARPDSVSFARILFEADGKISVEGTAESIANVKEFVDAINNAGNFYAEMKVDSVGGKTRFVISVIKAKK